MAVAALSATVTMVAVLGGLGVLPSPARQSVAPAQAAEPAVLLADSPADPSQIADDPSPIAGDPSPMSGDPSRTVPDPSPTVPSEALGTAAEVVALPPGSGSGRRVVFSESDQRVWLVAEDGQVERTYLVSGSVYDNLDPGTYQVYSRSRQAWGIDDSGTMRFFVRFTRGETAAIGFHDIPVADGQPVQSVDQLGTPQSHGCIRQRRADARALWRFAPLGTTVVVTV